MTLHQRALPGHDRLRAHTTSVGLITADADGDLKVSSIPVDVDGWAVDPRHEDQGAPR